MTLLTATLGLGHRAAIESQVRHLKFKQCRITWLVAAFSAYFGTLDYLRHLRLTICFLEPLRSYSLDLWCAFIWAAGPVVKTT